MKYSINSAGRIVAERDIYSLGGFIPKGSLGGFIADETQLSQPRIIVPYGSATMFISGPKIRMYDNAVLSRNFNQEGEIVLQGDAVMGYYFNSGVLYVF